VKLLLDTHALLWALLEPNRLPPRVAGLVRDPSNVLYVSAASAWEIATKYRIGKLPGAAAVVAGYAAHLATLRADELPIRASHALRAGSFAAEHRDPFDRVLAAQSLLEGIPLVTDDPAFSAFGVDTRW
jgi:PIN domain nuclease of toxin-antitoxin system